MNEDRKITNPTTESEDKWQEALRSGPHVFPSLHEAQKAVGTHD